MIYFFQTHNSLITESKHNSSAISRAYLTSVVGDVNIQGLTGFAFNIGTRTYFLMSRKRKISLRMARKIAKQYIKVFGAGPWEYPRLAAHIYRKSQRATLNRLAFGEFWDIYGIDYPFYGFEKPFLMVDL